MPFKGHLTRSRRLTRSLRGAHCGCRVSLHSGRIPLIDGVASMVIGLLLTLDVRFNSTATVSDVTEEVERMKSRTGSDSQNFNGFA
jgi:hypothetical protein